MCGRHRGGAGPAELTLAHELALGGAEVVVVERLTGRVEQTKGGAIQPRTAELLDARGLLDPIMERVHARPTVGGRFAGLPVELDCTPWNTRNPYPIGIPQWRFEEVLEDAATAVSQDADGVTVTADGELRARYLVACGGAHSTVRKLLGLPFPGRSGTFEAVLADIRLSSAYELVPKTAGHMSTLTREVEQYWGMLVPTDGDKYRFTFGKLDEADAPESDDAIQQARTALYGPTVLAEVLTRSRFGDSTRQLEQYRHGRVLFAGDAAHVHSPLGGQGLNLGVQDAINLGWKLAATIAGWAPEGLLDTYHAERHPRRPACCTTRPRNGFWPRPSPPRTCSRCARSSPTC